MTALLNTEHRIAGTVKFHATVSVEKLSGFISDMKQRNPECWVDLHIREAGKKGMHYIAFHYILADNKPKTSVKAIMSLLQYLRDKLGTSPKQGTGSDLIPLGVKGWSISTVKVMV